MSEWLPILGVIVGSATTLLAQVLGVRSTNRKESDQAVRQDRAERKAVIMRFLDAAQRLEKHQGDLRNGDPAADPDVIDRDLHTFWLAAKEVAITCSVELSHAANDYGATLHGLLRRGVTDRTLKDDAQGHFLEQARLELSRQRAERLAP